MLGAKSKEIKMAKVENRGEDEDYVDGIFTATFRLLEIVGVISVKY